MSFVARENLFAEFLFETVGNDEDDLAESGAGRIEYGVVHDRFARRADGVELLETTVTRSHAGGHDE